MHKSMKKVNFMTIFFSSDTTIAELIQEQIVSGIFRPTLQMEQEFLKGLDTDKISSFIEDCIAQKESLNRVGDVLILKVLL